MNPNTVHGANHWDTAITGKKTKIRHLSVFQTIHLAADLKATQNTKLKRSSFVHEIQKQQDDSIKRNQTLAIISDRLCLDPCVYTRMVQQPMLSKMVGLVSPSITQMAVQKQPMQLQEIL